MRYTFSCIFAMQSYKLFISSQTKYSLIRSNPTNRVLQPHKTDSIRKKSFNLQKRMRTKALPYGIISFLFL